MVGLYFLCCCLQLYKNVTQPLHLSEVCTQFASVHFYEGIVDLCLTMANKRDPQKLALHFYHNDEPPEDMQGVQELMQRYVSQCFLIQLTFQFFGYWLLYLMLELD